MGELFVEVRTEELPARFVVPAVEGLAANLAKLLGTLAPNPPRLFSTPRRFAVAFDGVEARRPLVERLVTGPPVGTAFKDGVATPAAEAFARKNGTTIDALEQVETPKGVVVAVRRMEGGESTTHLVGEGLSAAILAVPFKKTMRWGRGTVKFGRPIHAVTAVLDGERVDAEVAGISTGNTSVGHWLWHPEPFPVPDAMHWLAELNKRDVLADADERRRVMVRGLERAAERLGAELRLDDDLVAEVVNLVEFPTVIVGEFDASLLELPPRLLVEAMKVHQRYFPLYVDGRLSHRFLVVSNNPRGDADLIAAGNARVLAARFHDAKFFFAEDRKKSLANHGEKLAGMVWIRGLGTMFERQAAVAQAGGELAAAVGADPATTRAAGNLCKCDLATQMVGEFPELQGHVGRLLADAEGRPNALAIEEHYLPRFTGDALPTTAEGRALALAERITLLGAAFAKGMQPTGGADPQGLRRAANGIVAIVLDVGYDGDVASLCALAGVDRPDVTEFILARLRATLQAEGHATDLIEAVFATGGSDIVHIAERTRRMSDMVRSGEFGPIRTAFRRAAGLVKDHASAAFTPACFEHASEGALATALSGVNGTDVAGSLAALAALRPLLDDFFNAVLVMCDDPAVRANRLGLLKAVTSAFAPLADFTRLSSE